MLIFLNNSTTDGGVTLTPDPVVDSLDGVLMSIDLYDAQHGIAGKFYINKPKIRIIKKLYGSVCPCTTACTCKKFII